MADLPSHSKIDSRDETEDPEDENSQTRRRGRPRKKYPRYEGETEEAYLVRIARLQKKPLPRFASSVATTPERLVSHVKKSK
jgi:hypothetical protein